MDPAVDTGFVYDVLSPHIYSYISTLASAVASDDELDDGCNKLKFDVD